MKLPKFFIVTLAAAHSLIGLPASARTIPPINVSGEDDDAEMRACGISHASAEAASEAALRYNRVQLASDDAYIKSKAINLYVNLNVINLGQNCVISLSLSLRSSGYALNPVTKERQWSSFIYCEKGAILSWQKSDARRKVSEKVTDFTNQCLREYSKDD